MADRYEDYERGRRSGERREENDRGDWGREEPYNRSRGGRGNWEEPHQNYPGEERYGRNDWDRERRMSQGGEYGGRGEYGGNRGDWGNRGNDYGNRGNEYGNRGDWGNRGDYGNRGEWGNRASMGMRGGEYGNRGYSNDDFRRNRSEWGGDQSGNAGLFGTGSQGFGTGYRSGDFSSEGGAYGGYGGAGSYTGYGAGGSESYGGGSGMYGQQGQRQGRYSGRGPKGYQRGDERIREDVCERLTHHPEIDAVEIEVTVKDGEVTLTGSVDDRQAKRMAEDVAENVSGVKDVKNQVQVRQHQMAGASHSQSGTERSGEKTSTQKR